jgi:DNA-binding PadR family transcriptional regulator
MTISTSNITSHNGTLTTHSFYILLALADRNLHGYGIRSQIAQDSGGKIIIAPGTLYPALKRLVDNQLIEPAIYDGFSPNIKTRYRITDNGQRTLKAEAIRLSTLSLHARAKLGEQILRHP